MTDTFLLNDFYKVESTIENGERAILSTISLNAGHEIFKGHFEQMPIVPGVCQTQIIKELLQEQLKQNLLMPKGDNIKFMGMIIPQQHPIVTIEISYNLVETVYKTEAKIYFENTTFTKFKGDFIAI